MANQSKKHRKFIATSATAALVASAVAPAAGFAAETPNFTDVPAWAKANVDYLVEKGAIKGLPDGTFGPNQDITRAEVATILALSLDLEVDEDAVPSFADAKGHWAAKYIAAIESKEIIQGNEKGDFDPNGKIDRQSLATMVVKAYDLKLDESADISFPDNTSWGKDAVNILASLGVLVGTNGKANPTAKVTRAEVPAFVHRAEVPEVRVPVATKDAKVVSVSAINATQVEVKFNRAIDKDDVTTNATALLTIDGTGAASATLSADGKTATFTFANASEVEVTDGVVVVNPVVLADNPDATTLKYTSVLTYEDTVKPVIVSVSSKTNGTVSTSLTVTSSEPIASSYAKVNGTYYPVNFAGTDSATIDGLNLEAGKTHTLELVNLTDKGGNVTVSTSQSFTVTVDTAAPVATLSARSDKAILVTFNKAMNVDSVVAALATDAVKNELLGNVGYTAPVAAVTGSGNKQFLITITDTLYSNATSKTLSVVLPGTIKDSLGNAIAAGTKSVVLTKDTAKPTPTGYKVVKNPAGEITAIEVSFNEGLSLNADPVEPTVVNMNGVDVTSTLLGGLTADAVAAGDTKVVFQAGTPAKVTGKYAFSFGAGLVSDQAETTNTSSAFSYTIDLGASASAFSLPTGTPPVAAANVITVEFGRAVKGGAVANSATDLANYSLSGKPLPEGTTITLDDAQDTATITLPASNSIATTDGYAVFTAGNVMSLNGELLNTYTGTVSVVDNTQPLLTSAVISGGDLVLGFSETVTGVDGTDFLFQINGTTVSGYDVDPITSGGDKGKYSVTFKTVANAGKLYVDVNGDNAYTAADTIQIGTTTAADGPVGALNLTSGLITSVKVSVLDTSDIADTVPNTIKTGTVITVK